MNDVHVRLLAILQRKQEIDVECARASLARLHAQESTQEDTVRNLRALCAEHANGAAVRVGGRIDAATHSLALAHLLHLRADAARHQETASALRERIHEALARCAAHERKRTSTRELRAAGERRLRAEAQRRAAKESDRAWLARLAAASPGGSK